MRKSVVWLTLGVSLLLADMGQALALEVGAVRVRSHLNEPLVVTIPVQVDNIQQRDSLAATLAPETEYVARGLQPLAEPDDLVVQVVEGGNLEEMLIEVRSLSEVNEPFMGLVLQLTWDGGSQVQEFTLLLDPRPAMAEEEPAGLAPPAIDEYIRVQEDEYIRAQEIQEDAELRQLAEDMQGTPGVTVVQGEQPDVVIRKVSPDDYLSGRREGGEPVVIQPRSPFSDPELVEPSFTGDSYGPVETGETLWRIASQVRPSSSVSMEQVMAAIFAANPQAFDGSYETLKKGATLSIPSDETMRSAEVRRPAAAAPSQPAAQPELRETAADEPEETAADKPEEAAIEDLAEGERPGIWNTPETTEVDEAELEKKGGLVTKPAKAPLTGESTAGDAGDTADQTATEADSEATTPAGPAGTGTQGPGEVDYSALEEGDLEAPELDPEAVTKPEGATGMDMDMQPADSSGSSPMADTPDESMQEETDEPAVSQDPAAASGGATGGGVAGGDNTLKLAAAILLVILLTYWFYRRRRAREEAEAPASYAMPLTADDRDQGEDNLPEPPRIEEDDSRDSGLLGAGSIDETTEAGVGEGDATLEQANTYLSYGLYESAADTLNKGIAAEPDRSDLRMKLLETHEAAGNQDQFVAAAQEWQSSANPPDEEQRSRIESMGRNVAPGVALFAAGAAAAGLGAASWQDDEQTEEQPWDSGPQASTGEDLPDPDFDLDAGDELELPTKQADTAADDDYSEADSVALNLDLDEDLDTPLSEDKPAGRDDLDLPSLDLEQEDAPTSGPAGPSASERPQADDSSLDFDLDELDLDEGGTEGLSLEEPAESETAGGEEPAVASESEYDVKLDLAQAYLDMGEPDLAKGLLDEVTEGGNDSQRATAERLLQDVDQ